ncbi:MAG: BrnT family toxin [Proteobacteria bacterium]|nr:BrnT family toxin [Pseudomonadota bacterium]
MKSAADLYQWDEGKRAANVAKHGVDFTAVYDFDWIFALVKLDDRKEYAEIRYAAMAPIGNRLHVLAFSFRGDTVRVISLRKANDRERKLYNGT